MTRCIIQDMKQIKVYSYCINHNKKLLLCTLIWEPADGCRSCCQNKSSKNSADSDYFKQTNHGFILMWLNILESFFFFFLSLSGKFHKPRRFFFISGRVGLVLLLKP